MVSGSDGEVQDANNRKLRWAFSATQRLSACLPLNCQKCFALEAPTRLILALGLLHFSSGGTCQTRAQGKATCQVASLSSSGPVLIYAQDIHIHALYGGRKPASGLPRRKQAYFARHWKQSRVSIHFTQS